MTEHSQPTGPGFTGTPHPGPNAALETYFLQVEPATLEEINDAAELIGKHRETEGIEDALSICTDLAVALPNSTTVLAEMISTGHETIPKRWKTDSEEMAMVLKMVGFMEIGRLRAQEAAVRRGPGFPGLAERITEIEQLIGNLDGQP